MGQLLGTCVLASQEVITTLTCGHMVDAVYSQAPAHFTAAAVLPALKLQSLLADQQYADTVAVIGFVVQSAACPAHH
jgi:uridylate kinase